MHDRRWSTGSSLLWKYGESARSSMVMYTAKLRTDHHDSFLRENRFSRRLDASSIALFLLVFFSCSFSLYRCPVSPGTVLVVGAFPLPSRSPWQLEEATKIARTTTGRSPARRVDHIFGPFGSSTICAAAEHPPKLRSSRHCQKDHDRKCFSSSRHAFRGHCVTKSPTISSQPSPARECSKSHEIISLVNYTSYDYIRVTGII